ncbi:MAG: AmmeMemoRadiSam system radical SAM enzyme [Pseudomonadota bacterium]
MKEAMFYERLEGGKVKCYLCHQHCTIREGSRGFCGVRENRDGTLYTLVWERVVSRNADPIEKKPLFHFLPGSRSYSIATVGCNFRCTHCQNYDISQYPREHPERQELPGERISASAVVEDAVATGCGSISYTYVEPTIFFEYALECSRLAKERGLANVFVSNGYTTPEATRAIAPVLDANNIDLKSFSDAHYRRICGARLSPVLDTIRLMKELGVWVEVTTLVIPGLNDSEAELRDIAGFIRSVGVEVPWHVTQFFPTYRLTDRGRTPVATLARAREIGLEEGLRYVYTGNVPGETGENTFCYSCGGLLIRRVGYHISQLGIVNGRCPTCGAAIDGVFFRPEGTGHGQEGF